MGYISIFDGVRLGLTSQHESCCGGLQEKDEEELGS